MGGQQFGRHGPLQAYFLSLIPSGLTPEERGALFATEERKPPGHHGRIRFRDFKMTAHVRKKLPMPGAFLYDASRETARSSETPYPVSRAGPMKEGPVLPSSERSSPARKELPARFLGFPTGTPAMRYPSAVPRLRAAPAEAGRLMKNSAVPAPRREKS